MCTPEGSVKKTVAIPRFGALYRGSRGVRGAVATCRAA